VVLAKHRNNRPRLIKGRYDVYDESKTGSGEVPMFDPAFNLKTGGQKVLSFSLVQLMANYIKEVGTSRYIENYLEDYYRLSAATIKNLKKTATVGISDFPKNLRYLEKLIEHLLEEHEFKTISEFIGKSALNYGSFIQPSKGCVLRGLHYVKFSTADIKKIQERLDDDLVAEGLSWSRDKVLKHAKKFATYNKFFKFKKAYATWSGAKLLKAISTDPGKIIEVDILGLLPASRRYARDMYRNKGEPETKRLMKQLKRYMTDLKMWDGKVYVGDIWTWQDLVDRLRDAAKRARFKPYQKSILEELREERVRKRELLETKKAREDLERERTARQKAEQKEQSAQREAQEAKDVAKAIEESVKTAEEERAQRVEQVEQVEQVEEPVKTKKMEEELEESEEEGEKSEEEGEKSEEVVKEVLKNE
jgi:hypothetical protein